MTRCGLPSPTVQWREFVSAERLSASVDFPSSLFWRDLVRIYPNAKVAAAT